MWPRLGSLMALLVVLGGVAVGWSQTTPPRRPAVPARVTDDSPATDVDPPADAADAADADPPADAAPTVQPTPVQPPLRQAPLGPALNTPGLAVRAALADLTNPQVVGEPDRPFIWYVWIRDGDPLKAGRASFLVNSVISELDNPVVIEPVLINGGYLLRWDIRALAPKNPARLAKLLDQLIDPQLYLVSPLLDDVQSVEPASEEKQEPIEDPDDPPARRPTRKLTAEETRLWDEYEAKQKKLREAKAKREAQPPQLELKQEQRPAVIFGPSLGGEFYADGVQLQQLTQRSIPIVRYEHLLLTAGSSTDGRLYYDFIGLEKNEQGQRDFAQYIKRVAGVDLDDVAKVDSDQFTTMTISKITRKMRVVSMFRGFTTKVGTNQGLWSVTYDQADNVVTAENNPFRNVEGFRFAGGEAIGERANGGHVFILFDADYLVVDSAPDNIATDRLIPDHHGTKRLESAISCWRCHNTRENPDDPPPMGWKSLQFSLREMLRAGLDIPGSPEDIQRLVGKIEADFEKPLRRAREDYSDFSIRCARGGVTLTELITGIADDFAAFYYDEVNALIVLRELDPSVDPQITAEQASVELQRRMLPRLRELALQDPTLIGLIMNQPHRRQEFENLYQDMSRLLLAPEQLQQLPQAAQRFGTQPPPRVAARPVAARRVAAQNEADTVPTAANNTPPALPAESAPATPNQEVP